jgi:hypothetical protein
VTECVTGSLRDGADDGPWIHRKGKICCCRESEVLESSPTATDLMSRLGVLQLPSEHDAAKPKIGYDGSRRDEMKGGEFQVAEDLINDSMVVLLINIPEGQPSF